MATRFISQERILEHEGRVLRQPGLNRFVHWGMAVSIFILFLSGFGQMPIFKRYGMADLPGMAWTANYAVTLVLHYLATAMLLFVGVFHVVYHGVRGEFGLWPRRGDVRESAQIVKAMITGGKEPPSEKYLAEQRLAYAFIAANVVVLVVSGLVKVADNHPAFTFSTGVTWLATTLHNVSMLFLIFGIAGHLAAFVVPANRKLLGGIFHGKVEFAYVEHRHCLWCDRLREVHRHGMHVHAHDAKQAHVGHQDRDGASEGPAEAQPDTMEATGAATSGAATGIGTPEIAEGDGTPPEGQGEAMETAVAPDAR